MRALIIGISGQDGTILTNLLYEKGYEVFGTQITSTRIKDEYNQSFVFNKEFYKLFSNIIQLKNSLKGRFYAEFNNYGDVVYKDYIYLIDEQMDLLNIEMDYNSFVNDNEKVEPNVLNRIFTKIYEFLINREKKKFNIIIDGIKSFKWNEIKRTFSQIETIGFIN